MTILFTIVLLLLLALIIYLIFRVFEWVIKHKTRIISTLSIIGLLLILFFINHIFFKNMRFIQSEVYPNLYLVKYPDKNQKILQQAIKHKILKHLKTKHKIGKSLAYRDKNSVFFYEYGGRTYGFMGDAGTGYFINHEEDLGGFVTEELGMYFRYRLADFYHSPCTKDSSLTCGKIDFFKDGEFFKTENLIN